MARTAYSDLGARRVLAPPRVRCWRSNSARTRFDSDLPTDRARALSCAISAAVTRTRSVSSVAHTSIAGPSHNLLTRFVVVSNIIIFSVALFFVT